jgi:hypothetical protein
VHVTLANEKQKIFNKLQLNTIIFFAGVCGTKNAMIAPLNGLVFFFISY